jgi:uncharacterized membrane protein YhaH (DUF805 family)
LPLRRYAVFHGRSRRTELFAFYLLLSLLDLLVLLVFGRERAGSFLFAFWIVTTVPMTALMVRRLHDVGWSGWWLAPVAPLAIFNIWRHAMHFGDPFGPSSNCRSLPGSYSASTFSP